MKKVLLFALFALLTSATAHGVLLLVEDNGDGTIYIEAGLSTGGSAQGASVIIKEKASGKLISSDLKIPEEGHLTTEQPKVPYTVTVKLSQGHEVTKNGPLATNENKGDSKKDKK
ncbi:MAG: hypothetical protein FWF51_02760 [Chitinivibrionia bacterium]|nr:hypothetical protein [Chitinivibrionia bacterium]